MGIQTYIKPQAQVCTRDAMIVLMIRCANGQDQQLREGCRTVRARCGTFLMFLDGTEQNLDGTEQNLNGTEQNLNGTEQNLNGTEQNLNGTEQNLSGTERNLNGTERN